VALYRGALPEASSAALAAQLLGRDCRPSEAAVRAELKMRLQEALNRMDPLDREVLSLRHFEQLTTPEVARELGISEAAASKRYLRALLRLKDILSQMPGGAGDWQPLRPTPRRKPTPSMPSWKRSCSVAAEANSRPWMSTSSATRSWPSACARSSPP
jgi:hypothetical protein